MDLKTRLKNHRLVAPYIEGSNNKYGTNLLLLKDIVQFWTNAYNWTERQQYLNKYPQYITHIQGSKLKKIYQILNYLFQDWIYISSTLNQFLKERKIDHYYYCTVGPARLENFMTLSKYYKTLLSN